jgi:hypothetical protein
MAGSVRDFQAFARQTGNELVEQQEVAREFIHVLRRAERACRTARPGGRNPSERQRAQVLAEVGAHLRVLQRQLHGRLQETFLAAAVVALAFVLEGIDASCAIRRLMASVSWISPPTPVGWLRIS